MLKNEGWKIITPSNTAKGLISNDLEFLLKDAITNVDVSHDIHGEIGRRPQTEELWKIEEHLG